MSIQVAGLLASLLLSRAAADEAVVSHQTSIFSEHDNNVLEEVDSPRKSFPVRLLHRSELRKTYSQGYLDFLLRTGYRYYPHYSRENTLISDLTGLWIRSLSPDASFRFSTQARHRGLIENPRNYRGFNVDTAVQQGLSRRTDLLILFRFSDLHYQHYPAFDYRAPSVGFEIQKRFIGDLLARVHYYLWYRDFPNPTAYQGIERDRRDITQQVMIDLELYHLGNLVRPRYIMTVNRSLIGVFSYNSHQLRFEFGTALTGTTYLALYISLFQKYYLGGEGVFPQVKVDPEGEEETKLAAEISQKLPWRTSLGLRYVRCHNETIFRDRYYTKDLLSVSVSRNF